MLKFLKGFKMKFYEDNALNIIIEKIDYDIETQPDLEKKALLEC